jgi:hypothetical protein
MDAAITSALAACERSFARAAADLRHLRALVDAGQPTAPAADAEAEAAQSDEHGSNRSTLWRYTWNGQPTSIKGLAAIAGCTPKAMEGRLLAKRLTPEEAVALGANLRSGPRTRNKPKPAAVAADAAIETGQPGFSVFNPRPVPAHLVNDKPGLPRDRLPGQTA